VSELAIRRGAAPALAVEGLTYSYPGADRPALDAASLEVAPGEFVLLAGRSASGKSTLLKAACGLVPHFHGGEIEGAVAVAGMDAIEAGPGELAAAVGYVSQDPETQVVSTTVAAEIELPLELRGDPSTDRARAVEEVALALAIPHLLGRTVDTLSGGELQRVALAAALVTRPSLVLLDEPTSQLDPVAGDELIWLLRRLNEEWGVAVLLAEHRLERCLAAADRVVAMAAAEVAFDGAPAEFLAWSQLADPALETPAARLFSLAGIEPLPVGVRAARKSLEARALESPGPATAFPHPGKSGGAESRPPTAPVLSARALWVELEQAEQPHDVIKGIDLAVGRGERVALMGRNGAGKSTLLKTAPARTTSFASSPTSPPPVPVSSSPPTTSSLPPPSPSASSCSATAS
jgi:energy-coupling factor transport system ATP-binding protein